MRNPLKVVYDLYRTLRPKRDWRPREELYRDVLGEDYESLGVGAMTEDPRGLEPMKGLEKEAEDEV